MIIDSHAHLADYRIYPEFWTKGLAENMAQQMLEEKGVTLPGKLIENMIMGSLKDFEGSRLLSDMQEAQIDKSVVVINDFGYKATGIRLEIDEIFLLHYELQQKHKDKIVIIAGMDPGRGEAGLALLEKAFRDYQFMGLKLYPPCGFEIDDQRLYPYFELCRAFRVPVQIHTGNSMKGMKSTFQYPGSILKAAEDFTDVNFILVHAALLYFDTNSELPAMRKNIFLEVSGFQTLMHNRENILQKMRFLVNHYPDKILFGSDWPLFNTKLSNKSGIDFYRNCGIFDASTLALFFHENISRLIPGL